MKIAWLFTKIFSRRAQIARVHLLSQALNSSLLPLFVLQCFWLAPRWVVPIRMVIVTLAYTVKFADKICWQSTRKKYSVLKLSHWFAVCCLQFEINHAVVAGCSSQRGGIIDGCYMRRRCVAGTWAARNLTAGSPTEHFLALFFSFSESIIFL